MYTHLSLSLSLSLYLSLSIYLSLSLSSLSLLGRAGRRRGWRTTDVRLAGGGQWAVVHRPSKRSLFASAEPQASLSALVAPLHVHRRAPAWLARAAG